MADEIKIIVPGENGRGDQVFSGSSYEEAAKKLADAQLHASRKIAQQSEELETLRAEKQAREEAEAQAALEAEAKSRSNGNGYDHKHYLALLATDSAAANDYWFEHRFGAKPDDMAKDYQYVKTASFTSLQSQINAAFVQDHPELLQVSPEEDKANADQISKILTERNWAYTKDNLDAAYAYAKEKGLLKLPEGGKKKKEEAQVVTETVPTVMTSSGGQQTSATDERDKFLRTAPLDKVREFLEKEAAGATR